MIDPAEPNYYLILSNLTKNGDNSDEVYLLKQFISIYTHLEEKFSYRLYNL